MPVYLYVNPPQIRLGQTACWQIAYDGIDDEIASAWWEGVDCGQSIDSKVAWFDPELVSQQACFPYTSLPLGQCSAVPAHFNRTVVFYGNDGEEIARSNTVQFIVQPALPGQPPPGPGPGPGPGPPPGPPPEKCDGSPSGSCPAGTHWLLLPLPLCWQCVSDTPGGPPPGPPGPPDVDVVVNVYETFAPEIEAPEIDIPAITLALPGGPDILALLDNLDEQIEDIIDARALDVTMGIDAAFQAFQPTLLDVVTGLATTIANSLGKLLGNLTTPEDFWSAAGQAFAPAEGEIVPGWMKPLADLAGTIWTLLEEKFTAPAADSLQMLYDAVAQAPGDESNINSMLANVNALPGTPRFLTYLGLLMGLVPGAFGAANAGALTRWANASMRAYTPNDPSPELIAAVQVRSGGRVTGLAEAMATAGINPKWETAYLTAQRALLQPQFVLSAWLRGLIAMSEPGDYLARLGYDTADIGVLKELAFLQPTPQDLIRFLVREVFTPEIRAQFSQDAEFPAEAIPEGRKIGLADKTLRDYWAAHWDLPSASAGYEMFHRTTGSSSDPDADTLTLADGSTVQNVIGGETLATLLRTQDVLPYWRDKLLAISYNPLTRVDVRRMHAVGVLTTAEVERAYLDLGYSPQNALRLAQFVERVNAQAGAAGRATLADGLKARLITAYLNYTLSEATLIKALGQLGFDAEEVEAFVAEAVYIRDSNLATIVRTGTRKHYVDGTISVDTAVEKLKFYRFDEESIGDLLTLWDVEREFRDLSETELAERDLTKAEIIAAYRDKILTPEVGKTSLLALGYDSRETETLLALADAQDARTLRTAVRDATRVQFIGGRIDRLAATQRLDSAGIPAANREALLERWTIDRENALPDLTQAQIEAMVRQRIITDADAEAELRKLGHTDRQIGLLLALWQARRAPRITSNGR